MAEEVKTATPDDTIIDFGDGVKHTVKQLRDEHLMHSDYTKKTTEHAKDVAAFKEKQEAFRQQVEVVAPVFEWAQKIQDDPDYDAESELKEIAGKIRSAKKNGASPDRIAKLENEMQGIRDANKQIEDIEKQCGALRKSDPIFKKYEDEILEYAAKWTEKYGTVDLEEAFAAWKGRNHSKLSDDEPVIRGGRSDSGGTKMPEYDRSKSLFENYNIRKKYTET